MERLETAELVRDIAGTVRSLDRAADAFERADKRLELIYFGSYA